MNSVKISIKLKLYILKQNFHDDSQITYCQAKCDGGGGIVEGYINFNKLSLTLREEEGP